MHFQASMAERTVATGIPGPEAPNAVMARSTALQAAHSGMTDVSGTTTPSTPMKLSHTGLDFVITIGVSMTIMTATGSKMGSVKQTTGTAGRMGRTETQTRTDRVANADRHTEVHAEIRPLRQEKTDSFEPRVTLTIFPTIIVHVLPANGRKHVSLRVTAMPNPMVPVTVHRVEPEIVIITNGHFQRARENQGWGLPSERTTPK